MSEEALDKLTVEYEHFARAVEARCGAVLGSADEHHYDVRLSEVERLWLLDFSRRWEDSARDLMP